MSEVVTLGYWNARGLTEPIRYLLKYANIEFNDKRYEFGSGSTLQQIESIRKNWNPDKFNLELDFPNLPFYIEGDIKLTQSLAIIRYLGRKYGLYGNDDKSIARQDMVEQQLRDLSQNFIFGVLLDKAQFEKNKQVFLNQTLPQQLDLLSKFLGKNEWLVNRLTYVDFIAYELFDWLRQFSPNALDKYQNLQQFIIRFESLPAIAAYRKSSEFIDWPLVGPICCWGFSK